MHASVSFCDEDCCQGQPTENKERLPRCDFVNACTAKQRKGLSSPAGVASAGSIALKQQQYASHSGPSCSRQDCLTSDTVQYDSDIS